jgi:phosphopentomutase
MYSLNTVVNKIVGTTHTKDIMTHTVPQKAGVEEMESGQVLPVFNPFDSIFRKLANKESFSPDEVYKVVTAIEKKEASKKMIETFTANLKTMAEEAKLKEEVKRIDIPVSKTGKNAYEIRADVLQMAISWSSLEETNKPFVKASDDQLLNLAKKFYAFVENKR